VDPEDVRRAWMLANLGCILVPIVILTLGAFSLYLVQNPEPSSGIPLLMLAVAIFVVYITVFLLSILAVIWSMLQYQRVLKPFTIGRAK
ncbi:MAG TPA: hypothetical protein VKQ72_13080, partial [Aggregatilineales bacterium]|nr:hypothetical protein [Aggregatilineales bacterium]